VTRGPLTLKLDRRDHDLRIRVVGDLAFGTSHRLAQMLDRLGDLRGQTVVLDLSDSAFIDSSGLSAMVAAKLRGDREGFTLEVASAPAAIQRLLERTGLDRVLRPAAAES
jgi:anti-sigma B factor antagonist